MRSTSVAGSGRRARAEALDGSLLRKKVAVLGVTFKPHSDDVRDSPALDVAVQLKGLGADVVVTDPEGIDNARKRHPQLCTPTSPRRPCGTRTSSCS